MYMYTSGLMIKWDEFHLVRWWVIWFCKLSQDSKRIACVGVNQSFVVVFFVWFLGDVTESCRHRLHLVLCPRHILCFMFQLIIIWFIFLQAHRSLLFGCVLAQISLFIIINLCIFVVRNIYMLFSGITACLWQSSCCSMFRLGVWGRTGPSSTDQYYASVFILVHAIVPLTQFFVSGAENYRLVGNLLAQNKIWWPATFRILMCHYSVCRTWKTALERVKKLPYWS